MSFDIKFIRLDQKHVGLARQASPFLHCFWSRLINSVSKDTNMVFSMYEFFIVACLFTLFRLCLVDLKVNFMLVIITSFFSVCFQIKKELEFTTLNKKKAVSIDETHSN